MDLIIPLVHLLEVLFGSGPPRGKSEKIAELRDVLSSAQRIVICDDGNVRCIGRNLQLTPIVYYRGGSSILVLIIMSEVIVNRLALIVG